MTSLLYKQKATDTQKGEPVCSKTTAQEGRRRARALRFPRPFQRPLQHGAYIQTTSNYTAASKLQNQTPQISGDPVSNQGKHACSLLCLLVICVSPLPRPVLKCKYQISNVTYKKKCVCQVSNVSTSFTAVTFFFLAEIYCKTKETKFFKPPKIRKKANQPFLKQAKDQIKKQPLQPMVRTPFWKVSLLPPPQFVSDTAWVLREGKSLAFSTEIWG